MAGRLPEERVRRPLVQQSWRDVSFLHWRVDPAALAPILPEGLVPDVIDGSSWIGLTPFRVERFRVLSLPPVPRLAAFPETNLRTYVRDEQDRDGLWFFSLDVTSAANAAGGRVIAAPYFWSAMSVSTGQTVRYHCRRRTRPAAHHDIEIEPGELVEPSPLVDQLTGRWRAFTHRAGQLLEVCVEHEPWPLRAARLVRLDETVTAACGLPVAYDEPMVHHSDGVNARLGAPHRRRIKRAG